MSKAINAKKANKMLQTAGTSLKIAPGDRVVTSYERENQMRVKIVTEADGDSEQITQDMALGQAMGLLAVAVFARADTATKGSKSG